MVPPSVGKLGLLKEKVRVAVKAVVWGEVWVLTAEMKMAWVWGQMMERVKALLWEKLKDGEKVGMLVLESVLR